MAHLFTLQDGVGLDEHLSRLLPSDDDVPPLEPRLWGRRRVDTFDVEAGVSLKHLLSRVNVTCGLVNLQQVKLINYCVYNMFALLRIIMLNVCGRKNTQYNYITLLTWFHSNDFVNLSFGIVIHTEGGQ